MVDSLRATLAGLLDPERLRLGAAVVVVLVLLVLVIRGWRREPAFRVRARPLLTDNEIEFHGRLRDALPEYQILAQVSMGALIEPDVGGGTATWLSIRGRFAQKVVDYVVVDESMRVIALVELDDATHDRRRDLERDTITGLAGYPTLRYQSRAKPDVPTLRRDLFGLPPVRLREPRGRATP